MKKLLLATAAISASFMATSASAAIIVYTDQASFDAAAGVTTTETFDSFTTAAQFNAAPVDAGPFTVSLSGNSNNPAQNLIGPAPTNGSFDVNGTPNLSGRISNGGSIFLTFDSSISSFSGIFNEINNGNPNKTLLFAGGEQVAPVDGFFGIVSDVAFTTIEFQTIAGADDGFALDNVQFGAVPEPATWAFMIFGFGAIGGAMRRQRKANVKVSYA
ncbi:PEPxxWA-CTERM sorting domain-containing protein [Parasphingorhabdus cellanae]|uniref:PEP-CTERM sorting domain-containing protein n=1 Tax=Parasphingorhabdus cellanae TaxID=2806553 RepID=A0ABX7T1F1_9SPHN|nr:PEPxxWA-CTERM sorting domain-containing protein [Parasphingorhabdus cellanae]QTD55384.1 PEP-CTERM sorting domain-containing protein [Parasphingorhabdus cellanae]